jgi:2-amino-4-hydroxy-6-hydroxymethyldihydropteridine diphosphokinase
VPVTRYAIAIGSNRPGLHGRPEAELRAALAALEPVVAMSRMIATPPLGPSSRRFVNAVAILDSAETPPVMLARLKAIERAFGRRPGRRWGARVIDLDIILWSGGIWADAALTIPHAAFRVRRFVLDPLKMLVPAWRDPVTGLTVRQLAARARAVDRRPRRS